MKLFLPLLSFLLLGSLAGCVSTPYGAPPETSDAWKLIHSARNWLQQGRPRAALPSLGRALDVVENLRDDAAAYAHARSAIYNELGRVYEMVSELDRAEEHFLSAAGIARAVPDYRPLHFELSYNLSTVHERKAQNSESCAHLRHAAQLYRELLAQPAEPPAGYGARGEHFLHEVAAPRIRARAQRIGCELEL